jgi:hypothetical protein
VAYATPPRGGQGTHAWGRASIVLLTASPHPSGRGQPLPPCGRTARDESALASAAAFGCRVRVNRKHPRIAWRYESVFQSLSRLLRKGLPATERLVGDAGLRPPLKDRSLGRPKSAGADFLWRLPPSKEMRAWARISLEAATRRHGETVPLSMPHAQFHCLSRFARQREIGAAPTWALRL